MPVGTKRGALKELTFGNQIAEEERDALRSYFVKTQAWERVYNGEIDIVYGPKGSGKSALYVLIQDHSSEFFDKNVLLVAAENPQGSPAFRDLEAEPPTHEREFINIWKLYFLTLIAKTLSDFEIQNNDARTLTKTLQDNALLPKTNSPLAAIIASVRRYVRKYLNPSSAEGSVSTDAAGNPTFSGKITFEEPDLDRTSQGFMSVDHLLGIAAKAAQTAGYKCWITLDRLDVAFDESSDLERNALRALFKAYRDIREHESIRIKIFLRTDIWKRITEDGFREASHLSRDLHLEWNKESIQNLILRRLLNNKGIR